MGDPFIVGAMAAGTFPTDKPHFLKGTVDEVTYRKRALSAAEVIQVKNFGVRSNDSGLHGNWTFDGGTATDRSPFGRHGILRGGPVTAAGVAVADAALRFNGTTDRVETMVRGELGIYTTQFIDNEAGPLNADGARWGPTFLAQVPFYWGINPFDLADPQGKLYDPAIFDLYAAWRSVPADSTANQARRRIAEGERIFNTRTFTISGVSGFNDELGMAEVTATCGACHNAPNVGSNSQGRLMDIGLSDEERRTPDLPVYTFRNKATGAIVRSTDPGQALATKS